MPQDWSRPCPSVCTSQSNPVHLSALANHLDSTRSLHRQQNSYSDPSLPTCLYSHLSACLPIYLSACLPIYLSSYLSTYLPVCLSSYFSAGLPVCLPACLSACLPTVSACLSSYISACLSACLLACHAGPAQQMASSRSIFKSSSTSRYVQLDRHTESAAPLDDCDKLTEHSYCNSVISTDTDTGATAKSFLTFLQPD